jgi:hypothetical protein
MSVRDALSRLFSVRSNVEVIDEARIVLTNPAFEPLLTGQHETQAVRQLRRKVPGLRLLDAVVLVREASGTSGADGRTS